MFGYMCKRHAPNYNLIVINDGRTIHTQPINKYTFNIIFMYKYV